MTWDEFQNEITSLSSKVDFTPDIIVGISRGGLVPARLLSSTLCVKEMFCLTVKKRDGERFVTTEGTEDINGKHILLVEDMLETGKSLQVAKEYLERKGATVKTICLYSMPISRVIPDYSLREIDEVIQFPWEL